MSVRLLVALPPFPPGARVSFTESIESALVAAGLASATLDTSDDWVAPPSALSQRPLFLTSITPAERANPTGGMLGLPYRVFDDGYEWLRVNAAGDDLIPLGQADTGNRIMPLRDGVSAGSVQMRGTADSAGALGRLGFTVGVSSFTDAGVLFAAGQATRISRVTGSSDRGAVTSIVWDEPITAVHAAMLGLGSYVVSNTGPVLAASGQMLRLTWLSSDEVRALLIVEGPPTNYAGAAGTGSARMVSIYGMQLP
jgi:hypothetical protein